MSEVSYFDYQPTSTSRVRENVEWSITYTYNARDTENPRVLLIGDSICNGYQTKVREKLGDKVNVTFWASSKCVTDPDYFRELDFIAGAYPYQVVTFNNALHSLETDLAEWKEAYARAVGFLQEKLPQAKLSLVLGTPTRDEEKSQICRTLNAYALQLAEEKNLPVVDLYSAMDPLDRQNDWMDTYHFSPNAIELQAEFLKEHILSRLSLTEEKGTLVQKGSATGPAGAIR